jgi:methionine-rich copper-binding protein CopC
MSQRIRHSTLNIILPFQERIEQELTSAVPARAANAERKLKNRALDTVNPERTRIPKSPTLTKR